MPRCELSKPLRRVFRRAGEIFNAATAGWKKPPKSINEELGHVVDFKDITQPPSPSSTLQRGGTYRAGGINSSSSITQ